MSEAITGVGTDNPWDDQWKLVLGHIDELMKHHKVSAAIQYIFTSFFRLLGKFMEDYRMGRQADIMHDLNEIQQLRNEVEQDFQGFNTVRDDTSKPSPSGDQENAAQKALDAFKEMEKIFNEGKAKGYFTGDFLTGFLSHFFSDNSNATIFQAKDFNSTNKVDVATAWVDAWFDAGSVPTSGSPPSDSGLLGVINTQFNEAKTTSQSSVVQSKLNYYSKQDTTDKSVVHMGLSALSSVEKTANNNLGK